MTAEPVRIVVEHTAAPQGSKRSLGPGRPMIESSQRVRPYRQAVRDAATAVIEARDLPTITGPVRVRLTFVFPRPAGHWRTGRNAHLLRPTAPAYPDTQTAGDVDKLTRATLDALSCKSGAGLIRNDALVVDLTARKAYPDHDERQVGRVLIEVCELTP